MDRQRSHRSLNISHAFYQALGHDTLNPIAGRRVDINARMGAIELSLRSRMDPLSR